MNEILAVIATPGERAEIRKIKNELKTYQSLVNGSIECVPLDQSNKFDIILNEEGKLLGLLPNRYIFDGRDIAVGTVVVVKPDHSTGDWVTMTEQEARLVTTILNNTMI